jgi:hypothetical protein
VMSIAAYLATIVFGCLLSRVFRPRGWPIPTLPFVAMPPAGTPDDGSTSGTGDGRARSASLGAESWGCRPEYTPQALS